MKFSNTPQLVPVIEAYYLCIMQSLAHCYIIGLVACLWPFLAPHPLFCGWSMGRHRQTKRTQSLLSTHSWFLVLPSGRGSGLTSTAAWNLNKQHSVLCTCCMDIQATPTQWEILATIKFGEIPSPKVPHINNGVLHVLAAQNLGRHTLIWQFQALPMNLQIATNYFLS